MLGAGEGQSHGLDTGAGGGSRLAADEDGGLVDHRHAQPQMVVGHVAVMMVAPPEAASALCEGSHGECCDE